MKTGNGKQKDLPFQNKNLSYSEKAGALTPAFSYPYTTVVYDC